MPKVVIKVEDVDGLSRRQIVDGVVEKDLDEFNRFLTTEFKGTAPMASFERAMVKSFVMWKISDQLLKITT